MNLNKVMININSKWSMGVLSIGVLCVLTSCSFVNQISPVAMDKMSPELSATVGRVEGKVARSGLVDGIMSNVFSGTTTDTRVALYKEEQSKLDEALVNLTYQDVQSHTEIHAKTLQALSCFILKKSKKSKKNIEFVVSKNLKTEFLEYSEVQEKTDLAKAASTAKDTALKIAAADQTALFKAQEALEKLQALQAGKGSQEPNGKSGAPSVEQATQGDLATATAQAVLDVSAQQTKLAQAEANVKAAEAKYAKSKKDADKKTELAAKAEKEKAAITKVVPYGKTLDERGKAGLDIYLNHFCVLVPILSQNDNEKMLSALSSSLDACKKASIINVTEDISIQYGTVETIVKEMSLSSTFVPNTLPIRSQRKEIDSIIEFLGDPEAFYDKRVR